MKRLWMLLAVLALLTGCSSRHPVPPTQTIGETTGETAVETAAWETVQTVPPTQAPPPETAPTLPPEEDELVHVLTWAPDVRQELRYATGENFTGQQIYPFTESYLRYGTVRKLSAAQEKLSEQGYGIKIWDAYRPVSAQWTLWQVCPDPRYVANPERGSSNHSRGSAVDVTLVDSQGRELEMPTGFDDFSPRADRDYSDCTEVQAANARLLEQVMTDCGFRAYWGEWWHFDDTDSYPVEQSFQPPVG